MTMSTLPCFGSVHIKVDTHNAGGGKKPKPPSITVTVKPDGKGGLLFEDAFHPHEICTGDEALTRSIRELSRQSGTIGEGDLREWLKMILNHAAGVAERRDRRLSSTQHTKEQSFMEHLGRIRHVVTPHELDPYPHRVERKGWVRKKTRLVPARENRVK